MEDMAIRTLPAPEIMEKHLNGKAMRALQLKKRAELERLINEGRLQPATILNFNPIPLQVENAQIPYRVERAGAQLGSHVTIVVDGIKYEASYLTDKTAVFAYPLKNVQVLGEGELEKTYDVMPVLPIEKAHQFFLGYNTPENNVGGVLVFQGDIRVMEKKHNVIQVPTFRDLPDGTRSYSTTERPVKDVLTEILTKQRTYCGYRIAKAQSNHDDPEQRRNVTDIDREWAKFAKHMGWVEEVPLWTYHMTPAETEKCKGCAAPRVAGAYFCTCGRPYDAFEAYMAGENVAPVYLSNLGKEQLAEVKKESARRKAALEGLS